NSSPFSGCWATRWRVSICLRETGGFARPATVLANSALSSLPLLAEESLDSCLWAPVEPHRAPEKGGVPAWPGSHDRIGRRLWMAAFAGASHARNARTAPRHLLREACQGLSRVLPRFSAVPGRPNSRLRAASELSRAGHPGDHRAHA